MSGSKLNHIWRQAGSLTDATAAYHGTAVYVVGGWGEVWGQRGHADSDPCKGLLYRPVICQEGTCFVA